MSEIETLSEHLANLTILLDYFDKHGGARNHWVTREFEEGNARLIGLLKEKHDEARTGDQQQLWLDEAGTAGEGSQRLRRVPVGRDGRADGGGGATL